MTDSQPDLGFEPVQEGLGWLELTRPSVDFVTTNLKLAAGAIARSLRHQ